MTVVVAVMDVMGVRVIKAVILLRERVVIGGGAMATIREKVESKARIAVELIDIFVIERRCCNNNNNQTRNLLLFLPLNENYAPPPHPLEPRHLPSPNLQSPLVPI